MYQMKRLAYTFAVFVFGIIGLACVTVVTAFAEPKVDISPTCGPSEPGFNIVMNTNGFKANSTVSWKFVTSDNKIPLYGYYETNNTGGFNEVTFADDLREDNYRLYFADDADSDSVFDIGAKKVYANVTIPCVR